jgi:hypothetical protein
MGGDAELYRSLLREPTVARLHLAPLATRPSEEWAVLAQVALDEGHTIETLLEVVYHPDTWTFVGPESKYWETFRVDWEKLAKSNADARIVKLANLGAEEAAKRRDAYRQEEERERVYGRSYPT